MKLMVSKFKRNEEEKDNSIALELKPIE